MGITTEEFTERLELTRERVDAIVQQWVRQLPEGCHRRDAINVLHGPVPLAPRSADDRSRYIAVWALHEYRGASDVTWWTRSRSWRWRWLALRFARRRATGLLIIRKEVKAAEALGR